MLTTDWSQCNVFLHFLGGHCSDPARYKTQIVKFQTWNVRRNKTGGDHTLGAVTEVLHTAAKAPTLPWFTVERRYGGRGEEINLWEGSVREIKPKYDLKAEKLNCIQWPVTQLSTKRTFVLDWQHRIVLCNSQWPLHRKEKDSNKRRNSKGIVYIMCDSVQRSYFLANRHDMLCTAPYSIHMRR